MYCYSPSAVLHVYAKYTIYQTWIQDLLIQDQDQDFDVQDQDRDRDSRLTRPILEVHDWDMNCDKQKVMASRKSSIPVVAHSKQKTSYYV